MTVKRGFQKAVGKSFSTLPRMAKHRAALATKMAKKKWTKPMLEAGKIGQEKTIWVKKARLLEEKINGRPNISQG